MGGLDWGRRPGLLGPFLPQTGPVGVSTPIVQRTPRTFIHRSRHLHTALRGLGEPRGMGRTGGEPGRVWRSPAAGWQPSCRLGGLGSAPSPTPTRLSQDLATKTPGGRPPAAKNLLGCPLCLQLLLPHSQEAPWGGGGRRVEAPWARPAGRVPLSLSVQRGPTRLLLEHVTVCRACGEKAKGRGCSQVLLWPRRYIFLFQVGCALAATGHSLSFLFP